jgi:hypothetical protein
MATSPDGKLVYVAATTSASSTSTDYVVIAFDTATGVQRWVFLYPGTADLPYAIAYALAVSPDGSAVFVTGMTSNAGGSQTSIVTVGLAADTGSQLWSTALGGFGGPPDAATDGNRVYIGGYGVYQDPDGSTHIKAVTIAYDAATGGQVWLAHDSGNPGEDTLGANIAASPDGGRVYLAGAKLRSDGYTVDVLLFTYNAATGDLVQETHHPTVGFPPAGIAIARDGSRIFIEEANYETGTNNALTLAYDSTGNPLWVARYPTSCSDLFCSSRPWYFGPITVSPNGSTVFVAASYLHILNEEDFVALAYDAGTGVEKWEAMYPHNVADTITGPIIAANPNGKEVYVAGAANSVNVATLAYDSSTGNQNWLAIHSGGVQAGGIAVTPDGSQVFVAGTFLSAQIQPTGTETDLFALAYETTTPPLTPAPVLSGVVSRKMHGGAGSFDIDLPVIGPSGIECRTGGPTNDYIMIFTFSKNLSVVGSASVTSGTGSVSSSGIGPNPNQYTVSLTGVTNAQYISVTLTGVIDSAGDVGNFSGTLGVLIGDVNRSGRVDAADVSLVRQQTLQPVTASNFREDVNASGRIDAADVSVVRQQTLTSLP